MNKHVGFGQSCFPGSYEKLDHDGLAIPAGGRILGAGTAESTAEQERHLQ